MAATPRHTQEKTKAHYIVLHQMCIEGEDVQYSRQIPHNARPGIKEITKVLMTTHTVLSADKSRKIPDSFLKWDDALHAYTRNFEHELSTVRDREDLKFIASMQAPKEDAQFYFRVAVNNQGYIRRFDLFIDGRQYTIPLNEQGHPSNGADFKQEIIRILKNSGFGRVNVAEATIDLHPISVWTGSTYEWSAKRDENGVIQKKDYDKKYMRGIPAEDIFLIRDTDPKSATYGEVLIAPQVLAKAKQCSAGDDKLVPTIRYHYEQNTGKFLGAILFYYESAEGGALKEYPLTAEEVRCITDDSEPNTVMARILESKISHHIFIQDVSKIKKPDQVSPQFIFTINLPDAVVRPAGNQIAAVARELGVHPNQNVYLHSPLRLNASGTVVKPKVPVERRGSQSVRQSIMSVRQSIMIEAAKDDETSIYNFELSAAAKVSHDARYHVLETAKIHYRQGNQSITEEIDLNSKDAFELLLLKSVVNLIQRLDVLPQQKLFLELNATFVLMKSLYSPKMDEKSGGIAAMDPLALQFTAELAKLQHIPLFHEDGRVNAEMIKALNDLISRRKIPADAGALFEDLCQRLSAMHEEQIARLNSLDFNDDKQLREALEKWFDNLEHMLMVYGYDKNGAISAIVWEIKREIRDPKIQGMVNKALLNNLNMLSSKVSHPQALFNTVNKVYFALEQEYEENKQAQNAVLAQDAKWPEKVKKELTSLLAYLQQEDTKRLMSQGITRPSGVVKRIIEQKAAWDGLVKQIENYLNNEEKRVLLLQVNSSAITEFDELLKKCFNKIREFSAVETGIVYSYPGKEDKDFHEGIIEKCTEVKRHCFIILSRKEVNSPVHAASQSDPTNSIGSYVLQDLPSESLLPDSVSEKSGESSSISVNAPNPQDPFDFFMPPGSTLSVVENDPFLSDFVSDFSKRSASSSSSSSSAAPSHAAILSLYAPLTPTPISGGGHSSTALFSSVDQNDSEPVAPPPPLPPRESNANASSLNLTPPSDVSPPPSVPNLFGSDSSASAPSKVGDVPPPPPPMGSSLSLAEVMKKPPKLKPAQVNYQLGLYPFKKEDGKLPPSNSYPILIKYEDGTFAFLQKGEKEPAALNDLSEEELAGLNGLPFAEELMIIDKISSKVEKVLGRYTTAASKKTTETGMGSDLKNLLVGSMAERRGALEAKNKVLLSRNAYRLERVEKCPARSSDDPVLYFVEATRTCYLVPPYDKDMEEMEEDDWDTFEFQEFELAADVIIPAEDKGLLDLLLDTAVKKNLITLRADSPPALSSSSNAFFPAGSAKGNEGEASEKKEEKKSLSPKSPHHSPLSFHPSVEKKEGEEGTTAASGKVSPSLTDSVKK